MKRRQFIKGTAAGSTLLTLGAVSLSSFVSKPITKKITILHTNDTHSHIESFPADDPKNPNQGGVARRATLIQKIRSKESNVLLLDAGDIFQGTPFFNYYGGELEFKLMSMLQYDLATLGNHDFDNGLEGLLSQLPHAKFEFVNANYDFKNTILDGYIKPYKILNRDGIKIGVFGVGIELAGLVDAKNYKETVYHNPIDVANDTARKLKEDEKCDLVICLSHIGYQYSNNPTKLCDVVMAGKTKNIDMIIGGHTHTFLKVPTILKNSEGHDVLVNQVGCYGLNLGRIDVYFDENNAKVGTAGKSITVE